MVPTSINPVKSSVKFIRLILKYSGMIKGSSKPLISIIGTSLILSLIILQPIFISAIEFNSVPFDNLPIARINSSYGEYRLGADFSNDFGDEVVSIQDDKAISVKDMKLNKEDKELSLELECDSNDLCGIGLAPEYVRVYLVDSDIKDEQVANSSILRTELGGKDCGSQSIEYCANFDFSVPSDTSLKNYTIVIDMSFDEAQWIFINPVRILGQ